MKAQPELRLMHGLSDDQSSALPSRAYGSIA